MSMDEQLPIVAMRGIAKTFGSTRALRGVDFSVMPGEIHALLGRNGAGKSTLVSTLSGLVPADSGTIRIGRTVIEANGQSYAKRIRACLAHVQQTPQLFDQLTVAENLFLESSEIRNGFGAVDRRRMNAMAERLLDTWKMSIPPRAIVAELSAGGRQLLEIMKALCRGVPVIILDEPTAALSLNEKRVLFDHVRALKGKGVSFVYISHHLDEIFEIADTVTILRDGHVVVPRRPVAGLDAGAIADLMMGTKIVRSVREDHTDRAAPALLEARNIRTACFPDQCVDFRVHTGEIVALAGPVGGGKEDLAMILAGQQRPESGEIRSPSGRSPIIGLVPTDRHASGYVGMLGVRENVTAGGLEHLSGPLGFMDRRKEDERVRSLSARTHVVASSLEQPVSQLSGGNQQKVVFARALCRDPDIVVAMSPTRGVDVGAKEQLYALLRQLAGSGLGVIVVSDEEDEIEQLANRVVCMSGGQIVSELSGHYTTKNLILGMEGVQ